MRRNYGVNPDNLTDDELYSLYAEFEFTENKRCENNMLAFKAAIIEVVNLIFGQQE